jgi:hypothetical protein
MITGASTLIRTLLIYSICIPLAVFIGYTVTDPLQVSTFVEMALVFFILVIPLLLKWHREMLLLSWNLGAMLFFLPGKPELWLALAWVSFTFAILQYILNPRQKFLSAPSVIKPLIFMVVVVVFTALMRGGLGLAAFGSESYGAKRYLLILTAAVGFFAITSHRIAPHRAHLLVALFFLSSATIIIGDMAGYMAPGFYYIYLIFPLGEFGYEAIGDFSTHTDAIARMGGVAFGSFGIISAMMARYGISGILNTRKLLRFGFFLGLLAASFLGGFRSLLIQIAMTFAIVFYLEGLFRSRLMPLVAIAFVLMAVMIVGFSERMPLTVQRTISFLPVPIDPVARESAETTSKWRIDMWKKVLPDIPKYLLVGKGLGFSSADLRSLTTSSAGGHGEDTDSGAILAGDFHNGPLSVIIPFGIAGVVGFIWFVTASIRALYQNYKFGHPVFKHLNTFLFAYFVSKTVLFCFIFGSLYSDFATFAGVVALSIAVNGGIAKAVAVPRLQTKAERPFRIHPARRPVEAIQ